MFGYVKTDRNSIVIRGFDRSVTVALGLAFCSVRVRFSVNSAWFCL
ncbi:hypothetical protein SLEP1_g22578 [Rubroshorea leprosula]|uniref:Uncharacterized protein n=1 Tax=Rubroshorea leprosula TaxID=152421 RepID=A0AAV5J9M3_9ROSI|nr:hypothetical protein SLEP1_g22578 [Rubroshorea leprosula]